MTETLKIGIEMIATICYDRRGIWETSAGRGRPHFRLTGTETSVFSLCEDNYGFKRYAERSGNGAG